VPIFMKIGPAVWLVRVRHTYIHIQTDRYTSKNRNQTHILKKSFFAVRGGMYGGSRGGSLWVAVIENLVSSYDILK